jgi:hypothetical protein
MSEPPEHHQNYHHEGTKGTKKKETETLFLGEFIQGLNSPFPQFSVPPCTPWSILFSIAKVKQ